MKENDQAQVWNGAVADAWVRHADRFDATLAPLGHAAMHRLDLQPGERVLDVGCGVGITTVQIGGIVAPGDAVGVDISAPMIGEARRRLAADGPSNVTYLKGDVQYADLGGPFDAVFSRLGVMFFPDPGLAFAALSAALRPGGRLGFVCFQGPEANPSLLIPLLAAAEALELPTLPGPGVPGPLSLADAAHTTELLRSAGFEAVVIEPGPDQTVHRVGAEGLEAMATSMLEQTPMTSARMQNAGPEQRAAAVEAVVDALAPFHVDDQVRLGAGTWIVSARNTE